MSLNLETGPMSKAAGRHAFIVDDEPQILAFMTKAMQGAGFSASAFSRIADIEAALTRQKPDVVILDLTLGGTDAIEVMRSLAASRYGGKVLLVSGHDAATLEEVQLIGVRYGLAMLPFLRKPFRIAELTARVAAVTNSGGGTAGDVSLPTALQNNWLEVWYQPKFDLKSMLVGGAEALVRLRHPQHGVILPSAFLPPAGDPLYRPLSDFVIRRALADWVGLARIWSGMRLAVNVPVSVLQGTDFINGVRRHLPDDPKFPGLIFEITEDEAIREPELAREAATQLKLYNIDVSIDDFGAGHSSLARLKELPFAELKLDRSFVAGCAADARKLAMCRSVVELAHRFSMTAVAEGVETAEDLQVLIGMGYDLAQGYYFQRPMTGEDLTTMLATPAMKAHAFDGAGGGSRRIEGDR